MGIFSFINRKPKCVACNETLKNGYDNVTIRNIDDHTDDIKTIRVSILYCQICGSRYRINKLNKKIFIGKNGSFINHKLIDKRKSNEIDRLRKKKLKKLIKNIK